MGTAMNLHLAGVFLSNIVRAVRNAWLATVERHYTICAESEAMAATQARQNATYYQSRAALARAAREQHPVQ